MDIKQKRYSYIKYCLFITIYLGVLTINAQMFTIVFSLLCLFSLTGKEQAIKALSLVAISKFLNPGIYAFSPESGVLTWLVIFTASSVLIFSSISKFTTVMPLLIFSFVVGVLSVFFSVQPDISLMKVIVFTVVVMAIILGYSSLNEDQFNRLHIWFFSLFAVVIILSLPTFLFPNIAYNRNAAGFQGILNHPQIFGITLAIITTWFLAALLFEKKTKKITLNIIISISLLILMMLSQSRTSILAVFLSLFTVFILVFLKKNYFSKAFSGRALVMGVFFAIAVVITAFSSSVVQDNLTDFVFKRDSANLDDALFSRSSGIASQWRYFTESPIVGHGFGVYPWGVSPMGITYFKGIPISAPVEKGFLPTSVLEEVGVLGATLFFIFIYYLYKQVVMNKDVKLLALFFVCLFINVGEMVIFSVSGSGLFYWLLIGLTIFHKKSRNTTDASKPKLNDYRKLATLP